MSTPGSLLPEWKLIWRDGSSALWVVALRLSFGFGIAPGDAAELRFGLQPTSALVPKGRRLRASIAGRDADHFARIPAEGDPIITVERNRLHSSYLELPAVDWKRDRVRLCARETRESLAWRTTR